MTLAAARDRADLTQAQLARKARVDQKTISRIEAGQTKTPAYATVLRICRALGVDPQAIDEFRVNGGGAR